MEPLQRRIALVTGANRGIGLEIARQLAVRGFHVWMAARDLRKAAAVAQELAVDGRMVDAVQLEVTRSESALAAAAAIQSRCGRLDVLVNNAGVLMDRQQPPSLTPPDVLRSTMETNVIGVLKVTRSLLPLLRESGRGRVINISSGGGQLADMMSSVWAPAYQISKTALNALTMLLAGELKPQGISVNVICPGWCRTEMGGESAPNSAEQGADTAVWLATEAPAELTGKFFRNRQEIPW
ncbi:MAG: SDR family oxidoreductase [Verrucomicrobiales bacterium]|nr:SDR family oxidoreductase [Verrucomicrobiales bacterium]